MLHAPVLNISGKSVGALAAEDEDNDVLYFTISSELVNNILELRRTGPKNMDIVLKNKVDREVSSHHPLFLSYHIHMPHKATTSSAFSL